MVKKPSELINGPLPQTPVASQPTGSGNGLTSLIVVVLACVLGYLALTRIDWSDRDRKQDDHHEQKDDDKKQDDKTVAAKPGYLLIVRERIAGVDDDEAVQRVAKFARDAKFSNATDKLEYRDVDKDDDSEAVRKLIKHAESKGVSPPFVLFKTKENVLGGVIKLPAKSDPDSSLLEVFR